MHSEIDVFAYGEFLQIYPNLYLWTTYPLTVVLEDVYEAERRGKVLREDRNVLRKDKPDPVALNLELAAVLERALNFGHTGNTRTILKSVMEPLWLSQGILSTGYPSLNPDIVRPSSNSNAVVISSQNWPRREADNTPISAAFRAIEVHFGRTSALVRLLPSFAQNLFILATLSSFCTLCSTQRFCSVERLYWSQCIPVHSTCRFCSVE